MDSSGPIVDVLHELDRINRAFYNNMVLPHSEHTRLDAICQGASTITPVLVRTVVPDTYSIIENQIRNVAIDGQAGDVNYLHIYYGGNLQRHQDLFVCPLCNLLCVFSTS